MHFLILVVAYFLFAHISLLLPGYVLIKKTGYFKGKNGVELAMGYAATLVFAALVASATYAFGFPSLLGRVLGWLAIIAAAIECIRCRYYHDLWQLRFPLFCLVTMSAMALLFISLPFGGPYTIVPDPQPIAGSNYNVLNVKILNLAHTQANDNSIPYRQAQFFINRSDPAKDSFISEWGVSFFERTPLMGAVTADYFNLVHDKVPVAFLWAQGSQDPDRTYLQFQILASILNNLFILPAIFILTKFFSRKIAYATALFLAISPFFLHNTYFSWPKSLVAFFVLLAWVILINSKRRGDAIIAGCIGGVAYMTHDLAIFYIATTVVFLLLHRRVRDAVWVAGIPFAFALLWLVISSKIYAQTSSFVYYPLSTQGLPPADGKGVVRQFFHTSIFRILLIRLTNLAYLLAPYQLLTSEGGQSLQTRLFSLNLFSITGALGLSGMISLVGAFWKRLANKDILVLTLTPVACCILFIGWSKGLGAMHFAQAVVVLLLGLSVAFLYGLRQKLWLLAAYMLTAFQLIFFILVCYDFHWRTWLSSPRSIVIICAMLAIVCTYSFLLVSLVNDRKNILIPE